MAFMDIFKKKKAVEEDLDLPPMPPEGLGSSQDFGSEMPPPLEDEFGLPPLDEDIKPPTPIKGDIELSAQELPPLPSLSDGELELPPLEELQQMPQMPMAPMQTKKRPAMQQMPMQKKQPQMKAEERHLNQPIFLRVEKFRDVLQDISNAKASFKDTEAGMELLTATEEKITRELSRFRNNLDDMEKKLMFIDKVLFKNN